MQVFQLDRYNNHIHVSETEYPECRVPRQRWKGLKAIIKVGYKYIISKIKLYTLISCETRQILFVWDVFESQKNADTILTKMSWADFIFRLLFFSATFAGKNLSFFIFFFGFSAERKAFFLISKKNFQLIIKFSPIQCIWSIVHNKQQKHIISL